MFARCSLYFGIVTAILLPSLGHAQEAPQLNGAHFRITATEQHGFVNIKEETDGTLSFSGYCIDILNSISTPSRGNFTFDLFPPSGFGSKCNPPLSSSDTPYGASFRSQYKCGESDVTDLVQSNTSTEMYMSLYYVTPARQLANQFTLPFHPPTTGTLTMYGTATRIKSFADLVEQQQKGIQGPACVDEGAAYPDFLKNAFPEIQFVKVKNSDESFYQALVDGTCQVIINDNPIATHFVLERSLKGECNADGKPIGIIGDPLGFGLNQYAIGVRNDVPIQVVETMSYWLSILMTCSPGDPSGDCPSSEGGNLAQMYSSAGGSGTECGYILYPSTSDDNISAPAIAGIVIGSVLAVVIIYTLWHRHQLKKQKKRRIAKINALTAAAEKEKAAIMVENARKAAKAEQELNNYIAHEVRNPLAAAMSACSFVWSALEDETMPLTKTESRKSAIEDVKIIDSSLHFINDLLRNMLDMQRAASRQLVLDLSPTDLLKDVLDPVNSMLYNREKSFEVLVECPDNLAVLSDRLRLTQIMLNLGRNATKFVNRGFVRLRADVVDGFVRLYVEDSGPGMPVEKRKALFEKFQDSLDSLNQGTGIGLCLCKDLAELMKGDLSLDETYDSGIEGCPGTRFVLDLKIPPLQFDDEALDKYDKGPSSNDAADSEPSEENKTVDTEIEELGTESVELPEKLSVLFVDDDFVLRKLFSRSLKRVAPGWNVQEATNGETALRLTDSETFDLIFIDQYMASVQKQLLGTETARALRSKGVTSRLCGLSANDVEKAFLDAGADTFLFKPFPCEKDALKREIIRVLYGKGSPEDAV